MYDMSEGLIHCDHLECTASFKTSYWASIHAYSDGWFVKRNGEAYCPEHQPPWLAEWRERKARSDQRKDEEED